MELGVRQPSAGDGLWNFIPPQNMELGVRQLSAGGGLWDFVTRQNMELGVRQQSAGGGGLWDVMTVHKLQKTERKTCTQHTCRH